MVFAALEGSPEAHDGFFPGVIRLFTDYFYIRFLLHTLATGSLAVEEWASIQQCQTKSIQSSFAQLGFVD